MKCTDVLPFERSTPKQRSFCLFYNFLFAPRVSVEPGNHIETERGYGQVHWNAFRVCAP